MSETECHRRVSLPRGTVGDSEGWEVLVWAAGGQGYTWGQMHAGYCPKCGKYLRSTYGDEDEAMSLAEAPAEPEA